jgi:hypothetical protein
LQFGEVERKRIVGVAEIPAQGGCGPLVGARGSS